MEMLAKRILAFLLMTLPCVGELVKAQEAATAAPEGDTEAANDTVTLAEVEVKAYRPVTTLDSEGFVTNVTGTPLQTLPTALSVLGFIPGLTTGEGGVEVVGKGAPLIYINGRRMRDLTELEMISGARVKKVKVIMTPGARYGNGVQAVLKITTEKELGEGLSLNSNAKFDYGEFLTSNGWANLNYRTGGLELFGTGGYGWNRNKSQSKYGSNLYVRSHESVRSTDNSRSRNNSGNGKMGFNYITDSGHSFGAYYQIFGAYGKSRGSGNIMKWTDGELQEDWDYSMRNSGRNLQHLIDGYYIGEWGKWEAEGTFDILWGTNKNNKAETPLSEETTAQLTSTRGRTNNRLIAAEFNVSRWLRMVYLSVGCSYNNVWRKNEYTGVGTINPGTTSHNVENNAAVYADLFRKLWRLEARAGLRYEFSRSEYREAGPPEVRDRRDYHHLIPSVSLTMPVGQAYLQLAYRRAYIEPSFGQLTDIITFVNKYMYSTGDPLLRSAPIENVSLYGVYKWLSGSVDFYHQRHYHVVEDRIYPGTEDVILTQWTNSERPINKISVNVSLNPGLIARFYYPALNLSYMQQFHKIPYMDGELKLNRPEFRIEFRNMFMLPCEFKLYANASWTSRRDFGQMTIGSEWMMLLGASKTFGSHWDVEFTAYDIFNTRGRREVTTYSNHGKSFSNRKWYNRMFEISVSYKFNMADSKYKGRGTAHSERERL